MKQDNSRNILKYMLWAETVILMVCLFCLYISPHLSAVFLLLFFAATIADILTGFKLIEKMVDNTMQNVDDTIQSLIDKNPADHFSQTDDTLLGKFQMQILKLRDILSSYEQLEKELRIQTSESISNLVHQINTPITNIKMYSSFLEEDTLSEAERILFLSHISSQAGKLEWLSEGLSKVSRLETGIITIAARVQPLLPAILKAVDQVSLKAMDHGNDIILHGGQDIEAEFDQKWTEEVFYNLLDNAVKYSVPNSSIMIELLEYELFIRINVKDTGLSLNQNEYSRIFHRFYRGSAVKDQEGVGLGLYLSREIILKQKGYMKASMTADCETMFSVFLPKGNKL